MVSAVSSCTHGAITQSLAKLKRLFAPLVCSVVLLGISVQSAVAAATAYSIGSGSLYSIDIVSGAETLIGSLGVVGDFEALAFDPTSGTLYTASDGDSLYTVNTATGAATLVGATASVSGNTGMAFDGTGQGYLLGNDFTTGFLESFDKTTGAATTVGSQTVALSGAAFVGSTLYGTSDNGGGGGVLATVDTTTGVATTVGSLGIASISQTGLSYDPIADLLYLLDESTAAIYTLDLVSGGATFVSSVNGGLVFESLAVVSVGAVPVPAAVWLFASGLGLLGLVRRKRA